MIFILCLLLNIKWISTLNQTVKYGNSKIWKTKCIFFIKSHLSFSPQSVSWSVTQKGCDTQYTIIQENFSKETKHVWATFGEIKGYSNTLPESPCHLHLRLAEKRQLERKGKSGVTSIHYFLLRFSMDKRLQKPRKQQCPPVSHKQVTFLGKRPEGLEEQTCSTCHASKSYPLTRHTPWKTLLP